MDLTRNGMEAKRSVPSSVDKDVAKKVQHLREQIYLVLPDDVMRWAIHRLDRGDPSCVGLRGRRADDTIEGWYHGWMRRTFFLT